MHQTTTAPPLSVGLMTMSSRVIRFWWAVHYFLERFENLAEAFVEIEFLDVYVAFFNKEIDGIKLAIRWCPTKLLRFEPFEFVCLKLVGRGIGPLARSSPLFQNKTMETPTGNDWDRVCINLLRFRLMKVAGMVSELSSGYSELVFSKKS